MDSFHDWFENVYLPTIRRIFKKALNDKFDDIEFKLIPWEDQYGS